MHKMVFDKFFDLSTPSLCLILDLKLAKVLLEIFRCSWILALEKLKILCGEQSQNSTIATYIKNNEY